MVRHSTEGWLARSLEVLGVRPTRGLHPDCITKPPAASGVLATPATHACKSTIFCYSAPLQNLVIDACI